MTDAAPFSAGEVPADLANARAALRRAVATAAALGCGIDIGATYDVARGAIVFSIGGLDAGVAVAVDAQRVDRDGAVGITVDPVDARGAADPGNHGGAGVVDPPRGDCS